MFNLFYRVGCLIYAYTLGIHNRNEIRNIKYLLKTLNINASLCDIGSGKGRGLKLFSDMGYSVTGVEINPSFIQVAKEHGFNCVSPDDFFKENKTYDVLAMLHIIEHFTPEKLKDFMDSYLDRLSMGGILILATPMPVRTFYYDFDHVRPYLPLGIEMVFGGTDAQVQYCSRNKIKRIGLCYTRGPYTGYSLLTNNLLSIIIAIVGLILYALSFGIIGYRSQWVASYRKV